MAAIAVMCVRVVRVSVSSMHLGRMRRRVQRMIVSVCPVFIPPSSMLLLCVVRLQI